MNIVKRETRVPLTADRVAIKKALRLILEPGSVAELRVLGTRRGTVSGYFDDLDRMAESAAELSGNASGVYMTLNPVRSDLLARAANHVRYAKHTTSDADIVRLRWLPIDFDPARPAGISSTDEEHNAALDRAKQGRDLLRALGWPELILADSGNGAHLLPRIDLPSDAQGCDLVRRCLAALALQLTDAQVTVDLKTFNPARIWKVYGTVSAKGDSTSDRPHRIARLLKVPDKIEVVSREQLERLAAKLPQAPAGRSTRRDGFDLASWIDEHKLNVARTGPWNDGGRKWVLGVCPWNPEHTDRSAFIVQFPNGAIAAGCHHNGCSGKGWHDLRKLMEPDWNGPADQVGQGDFASPYAETESGIVWFKPTHHGQVIQVPLTSFKARIVSDVEEDDGSEIQRWYEIAAQVGTRRLRVNVPAAQFGGMNWVAERLGANAIVQPGLGQRDHARAAIQALSKDVCQRTVYAHLGWRRVADRWVYLHAGGAIDANGSVENVELSLNEALRGFALPDPPDRLQVVTALRSSLKLLELAPDPLTVSLYAAIWRAVLGGTDFSIHFSGRTGAGKTELAALAQQHFGAGLDARHLPTSWLSTGNYLEGLAFLAKDALLVVDDLAPTGSTIDVQRSHREAERLLRAQGNKLGRGRMRADSTLRPLKLPRSLIVSTGEDVPRGQSLRARVLILELGKTDLNWELLTSCQLDAAAGLYAQALAGFLRWLAESYDEVRGGLRSEVTDLRKTALASDQHRRTPEIVANLGAGLRYFFDFAVQSGALTTPEADALRQRTWTALGEAAKAQGEQQAASDPTRRFLRLLGSTLASGGAHVAGVDGDPPRRANAWGWREHDQGDRVTWHPQGSRVGWLDGDTDLYLDMDAAYAAAQRMAGSLGESIAISPRTLLKRLHEQGLLSTTELHPRGTLTVRRTLEARRRDVVHLAAAALGDCTDKKVDQLDQGTLPQF